MAYTLNGSSQYLEHTAAVVAGMPVSMACWGQSATATAGQGAMALCESSGAAAYRWSLEFRGNITGDPIRATHYPTLQQADTSTGYTPNTWHHVCAVFEDEEYRAVYIDGGSKGTDTADAVESPTPDTTLIGALRYTGGYLYYLNGKVAEAAFWNVDLTDAEVAALAAGFSPLFVRPASLVAYWPLIGRSSPEPDIVGGYDMTLVGSPTVAAHPRIIYPSPQHLSHIAPAAAAGLARLIGGGFFPSTTG